MENLIAITGWLAYKVRSSKAAATAANSLLRADRGYLNP
jgi:hypothetical protein